VELPESAQIRRSSPIEGIEIWKNAKNKFLVFQLHYSANPAKRLESWKDAVRSAMPRAQYLMEYEIHWDSFAGLPVYPDYNAKVHESQERIQPWAGLPLLRGWDFGLTPACVVAQMQEDRLVVIREFTELNMGADRFSAKVLKQCAVLFPEWSDSTKHWRDFIDPSGEFRKDTDEGTCAQILRDKGLSCYAGAISFEERRKAVEEFLVRQTREGARFLIDPVECPVLTRGFKGGYRYPEKSAEIEPAKLRPLKDEHSHPHDALQMIATRVTLLRHDTPLRIPAESYGRSA
jgi:hypothetical protein